MRLSAPQYPVDAGLRALGRWVESFLADAWAPPVLPLFGDTRAGSSGARKDWNRYLCEPLRPSGAGFAGDEKKG